MGLRICFIGDSFVLGVGDPDCLGWSGRICATARRRGVDITSYNLGVRRETSLDIARRWQAEVAPRLPPDVDGRIVFSFGVNDCMADETTLAPRLAPDESLAAAEAILDKARARPVLMVGPPPVRDAEADARLAVLSQAFSALCARLGIAYLDVHRALHDAIIWLEEAKSGDGAHPGRGGYSVLASLVEAWPPWAGWTDGGARPP